MIYLLFLFICSVISSISAQDYPIKVSSIAEEQYVGKVKFESISIRLLVLRHCPDQVGNTDSKLVLQAANLAASKGLTIQDIGDYRINRNGLKDKLVWSSDKNIEALDEVKKFINIQACVDAKPGDTLVIYTMGHGGGDGTLVTLGTRQELFKVLAEVAEENNQEIFWWQLSCHAGSKLPEISTLNETQQMLFSMTASSGQELSYFCTQGAIMQKIFVAMAERSDEIDPNKDEIVDCKELSDFIAKYYGTKRGGLVFARSPEEPIFGLLGGLANAIPIVDRNNKQGDYKKNYIPLPKKN